MPHEDIRRKGKQEPPSPAAGASGGKAVLLPQLEPGILGVQLVVAVIGGRDVGGLQRPGVRESDQALQPLDFGDGLLRVHRK